MAQDVWTAERAQEFARLRGRRITSWAGVEMALREETAAGGPQFEDPAVPCLQMVVLGARFEDGTFGRIDTYQSDSACGLWLRRTATDESAGWAPRAGGIYRLRALPELPTGEIGSVATFLDHEVLAEVLLHVGDRPVLLMAGELYESAQERLRFVRCDESVLVFTDPSAAAAVDWIPPRHPRA